MVRQAHHERTALRQAHDERTALRQAHDERTALRQAQGEREIEDEAKTKRAWGFGELGEVFGWNDVLRSGRGWGIVGNEGCGSSEVGTRGVIGWTPGVSDGLSKDVMTWLYTVSKRAVREFGKSLTLGLAFLYSFFRICRLPCPAAWT